MNSDSEVFKLCLKFSVTSVLVITKALGLYHNVYSLYAWKNVKILARISMGKVVKRIIAPVKEYYCSEEYHGYIGIAVDH